MQHMIFECKLQSAVQLAIDLYKATYTHTCVYTLIHVHTLITSQSCKILWVVR